MKKFLSLVLALVMTMSLVTISAGAAEYKDLTDKGDIQYEEAVAVLNKVGIITGYEDGSFKPTNNLTRGAAAKIIVSLMIGPEAAAALTVTTAPYKDVPVTNTFAAVISFCKTAGYISGYGDNTFRPSDPLTGYAFAKMLLGALGYKADVEGFVGSGWTMKVASAGTVAGLYNDFNTPFSGVTAVTREVACQLALNTLKATKVEYKGNNINVSTGDANVSITDQNHTDVANSSKTDGNIYKNPYGGFVGGLDGKMQFAEEHFTDLKQVSGSGTTDKYGHPANQWAYKGVTIGKYSVTPNFVFTTGGSGDTKLDQLKSLGLDGYKVSTGTSVVVDGNANSAATVFPGLGAIAANITSSTTWVTNFVNLFSNGTKIEIFVSNTAADTLQAIVVTHSQLMQVNTVSTKNVTLKQADNVTYVAVGTVKEGDNGFNELKGLKADDYVLVTYIQDGGYKVDTVTTPTTATGTLTAISKNKSNNVNGITVGGTAYKLSNNHDTDIDALNISSITSAKKDVTVYLDAYGYVAGQKDITGSADYMIVGNKSLATVNGKLVTALEGYDMNGDPIVINVNSSYASTVTPYYGDIIKYTASNNSSYDYNIVTASVANTDPSTGVQSGYVELDTAGDYAATDLSSGDITIKGIGFGGATIDRVIASGVKTLFVTYNSDGTIDSITKKTGVANVPFADLLKTGSNNVGSTEGTQMYVNKSGAVETIVVKTSSTDAISANVAYVQSTKGSAVIDGVRTYTYHVWINGSEEDFVSTNSLSTPCVASYAEKADGTYQMNAVTRYDAATSSFVLIMNKNFINLANKNLVYNVNTTSNTFTDAVSAPVYQLDGQALDRSMSTVGATAIVAGSLANQIASAQTLDFSGSVWNDLTYNGISSMKALLESDQVANTNAANIKLLITMNNKVGADNRYKVSNVTVLFAQ